MHLTCFPCSPFCPGDPGAPGNPASPWAQMNVCVSKRSATLTCSHTHTYAVGNWKVHLHSLLSHACGSTGFSPLSQGSFLTVPNPIQHSVPGVAPLSTLTSLGPSCGTLQVIHQLSTDPTAATTPRKGSHVGPQTQSPDYNANKLF